MTKSEHSYASRVGNRLKNGTTIISSPLYVDAELQTSDGIND